MVDALQQPTRLAPSPGDSRQHNYRPLIESGRLPGDACSITSEDFAPLRTAKIHVTLRQKPLEAMLHMQDVICHMLDFECRECRVRFPAFHPDYPPPLELQITKQCPNDVAEWEGGEPPAASAKQATHCRGLCGACQRELKKVENDELLRGVVRFGAKNYQDPLAGFPATDPVQLLDMQLHDLFRQATVLEAMLVSLNHMQVCVCTYEQRWAARTGLSRFRKNIIAFPQHVSDLQQHMSFVEGVRENDVVNVALSGGEADLVRARVLEVRPDGFRVEIAGNAEPIVVSPSEVRNRLRLPWRPKDLEHALIVMRRRSGRNNEFVEDLRVRRPFVVALLRALSKRGPWREHRGIEPMHMYYTEFDWLPDTEIEAVLPEDGLPETLVVQDFDDVHMPAGLTRAAFQDWLHEGRHDCDAAKMMLRYWVQVSRGSCQDTYADFFDQLYADYIEHLPAEEKERRREEDREREGELPVKHIAELMRVAGYVPFDVAGLDAETIATHLCDDIFGEVAVVRAYTDAWRGSVVVPPPERQAVAEEIAEICENAVHPWPAVDKTPVPAIEEGRFAKAYPLEFPMGTGDLKQPQLRQDYTATEWAQHKFRYFDGRFVSSSRGHRVTWAIFDTALLEHSRHRGHAYHKATDSHVLTKRNLRELIQTREDLVRTMAAFGADIPTTPMFWKRMTTQLEWCVRQMSWFPAWIWGADVEEPTSAAQATVAAAAAAAARAAADVCVSSSRAEEPLPARQRERRRRAARVDEGALGELDVTASEDDADDDGDEEEVGEGGDAESPIDADGAAAEDAATGPPQPYAPPEEVWARVPMDVARRDDHGYGRIPAFWFTLNCPYNYLHEIHRFHADDATLRGTDAESRSRRVKWCYDHPDMVCFLHALRVELLVRMVMPAIVPTSSTQPFHYWVRFEEGLSGNPHAHGLAYAAGNPSLCGVESRTRRAEAEMPEEDRRAQMANELSKYFGDLASEWHPAKDQGGNELYDFIVENLDDDLGCPQTIDLRALLQEVLGRTSRISRR